MAESLTTHILYINVTAEININEEYVELDLDSTCESSCVLSSVDKKISSKGNQINPEKETLIEQSPFKPEEAREEIYLEDSSSDCVMNSSIEIVGDEEGEQTTLTHISEPNPETPTREQTTETSAIEPTTETSTIEQNTVTLTSTLKKESPSLKCPKCRYVTRSKVCLRKHLLKHNKHPKYKCPYCTYEGMSKNGVDVHMLNRCRNLLRCFVCDFATHTKSHFDAHRLTHAHAKALKCSACGFETFRKGDLEQHARIHQGLKLFNCGECSYATNRNRDLVRHMLVHSTDKRFECSLCSFRSHYNSGLKRHIFRHHEKNFFSCPECYFETVDKAKFKQHIKTHS